MLFMQMLEQQLGGIILHESLDYCSEIQEKENGKRETSRKKRKPISDMQKWDVCENTVYR